MHNLNKAFSNIKATCMPVMKTPPNALKNNEKLDSMDFQCIHCLCPMHHRRAIALKKSSIKEQNVTTLEPAALAMPDKGIRCADFRPESNAFKVTDST